MYFLNVDESNKKKRHNKNVDFFYVFTLYFRKLVKKLYLLFFAISFFKVVMKCFKWKIVFSQEKPHKLWETIYDNNFMKVILDAEYNRRSS